VNRCYCDESGTGDEPVAVMTGIVVDASRMHLTKQHWGDLLATLSKATGHQIVELHTRDFYAGNGVFRGIQGKDRAYLISQIFDWLAERKHDVVYSSVVKSSYFEAVKSGEIPDELNTIWRFLGFYLILAMQKYCQKEDGVKGHTIFVFDNEERERMRFTDLIHRPPDWSDTYYDRKPKQAQLDQIVDVPYFGDSREVPLIQLADLTSFFLRRAAEVGEGLIGPRYDDEAENLGEWVGTFLNRSIRIANIYPTRGRQYSTDLFYKHAPPSIRDMS
jgi:hypothetical protein